ncbi:MAG: ribonuclease R [Acidobacteria bacterium]|nr:ribonuclease R [Acidobacteriota bacterium]
MLTPSQKQSVLRFISSLQAKSFTFRDVVRRLDLDSEDRRSLQRFLDELDSQEIIHKVRRGRYSLPEREAAVSGVLIGHRDGYAFLAPDSREVYKQDIFIPPHGMEGAMHGDRVLIRVARKKTRPYRGRSRARGRPALREGRERLEGTVLRVLERRSATVVGRFYEHPRFPFVVPLDSRIPQDIRIPFHAAKGARNGQIVTVSLTTFPGRYENPHGRVIDVLGYPDDPGIEYRIVEAKYSLPVEFSPETLRELDAIPDRVTEAEHAGREDFRSLPAVTIDGETARDFDDAVSLRRLPSGRFELGVHIADVSHYVREESAVDRDAYLRGTSVYFPDRAIPMLPARLSSGICSLQADQDRLVVSAIIEVDKGGTVTSSRIVPGVLRSRARMTYTSVGRILEDDDPKEKTKYAELVPMFEAMRELCLLLAKKRYRRGAVDFDLPEAEIRFDDRGRVINVVPAARNIAHRIIEEFMLLANETVAMQLSSSGGPALYRVHEEPDPQKVDDFAAFVLTMGYSLESRGQEYRPRDFQRFVEQLEGKPEGRFLAYLMLRSFMQARYSEKKLGHFGLATREYTHFTSPIRRYPDLVVHRMLKECLKGTPSPAWREKTAAELPETARHASERERIADEAEREIEKIKKVQFMAGKIGDEFEGLVFSVTRLGFSVELLEHFVEGFVPAATLIDDEYSYKEKTHCFIGERRRKRIRLGSMVVVRLDSADRESYRLSFSLVRTT